MTQWKVWGRSGRWVGCVLVLALAMPGAVHGAAEVTDLRVWQAPDSTRVVLELSDATAHKVFALSNPPRIVVDLDGARIAGGFKPQLAEGSPLSGVRFGAGSRGATRIVLDLADARRFQGFALTPTPQHGHRLVIDLYAPGAEAQPLAEVPPFPLAAPPELAPTPTTASAAGVPIAPVPPRVAPEAASGPPKIALATGLPVSPRPAVVPEPAIRVRPVPVAPISVVPGAAPVTIVIDPGHGGADPGARGRLGTREKDVVLALSRALAKRINAQPGMRAVLTRNGDYFLPLRSRVEYAHRANADLFVSIHADAAPRRDARGSGVYALSERGATNEAARLLAAKENAADLIGGVPVSDTRDPVLRSVLLDLSQSATIESGLRLSQYLLGRIRGVNTLHQRNVQQAGFVVLKSPNVPSVLVESAFISNPEEEARLRDPKFHARFAEALFAGIREYTATDPRLQSALAGAPDTHVVRAGETLSGLAVRYGIESAEMVQANPDLAGQVRVGDRVRIPAGDGG